MKRVQSKEDNADDKIKIHALDVRPHFLVSLDSKVVGQLFFSKAGVLEKISAGKLSGDFPMRWHAKP